MMERPDHSMSNLFAQLGKPNDEAAIAAFIANCRPLENSVLLHEAAFWTPAQAGFLKEAIQDDADWAEVADALNNALHHAHNEHPPGASAS